VPNHTKDQESGR